MQSPKSTTLSMIVISVEVKKEDMLFLISNVAIDTDLVMHRKTSKRGGQ